MSQGKEKSNRKTPYTTKSPISSIPERYSLISQKTIDGFETGYFTRLPDGVSGMFPSNLAIGSATARRAIVCGVEKTEIEELIQKMEKFDRENSEDEGITKPLIPFTGMDLGLSSNDPFNRFIVYDEACMAILEHYAFEVSSTIALENFRRCAHLGMRGFIWEKTGYILGFQHLEDYAQIRKLEIQLKISNSQLEIQKYYLDIEKEKTEQERLINERHLVNHDRRFPVILKGEQE